MLRRSIVLVIASFIACAACATLLCGCPTQAPPKPCARVGDSCEVSPGKLGTCVKRDECMGGTCLVCQSQH